MLLQRPSKLIKLLSDMCACPHLNVVYFLITYYACLSHKFDPLGLYICVYVCHIRILFSHANL